MTQNQTQSQQSQSQSSTQGPGETLLSAYRPLPDRLDEFVGRDGQLRPSVQAFGARLNEMGSNGLANAWKRGDEMLRDNGLSHNLDKSATSPRPWNLDPIPMIFNEKEWEPLVTAAIQRARLWDAILKDCYGSRSLIAEGLLPPSLLFAQPGFNRSLPLPEPDQSLLNFYAVDLARCSDGTWTVLADRTEAPNGTGFALENRIILSNVFPETSNRLHLVRLAGYFQNLQTTLFARVPHAVDEPGVVLLSPGPSDPTYFEDAYLARYLGIPLAVGEELTVRDDRVFLKTVSRLKRIHVIYRRVHETLIDPLENPAASNKGVAGLMQAVRAGTVTVLNPPGTGIAESPAFLPYLPAIAKKLLGQDLLLPSIETIWGGQRETFQEALPQFLDQGLGFVKNSFGLRLPPIPTKNLTPEKRAGLLERIERDPSSFSLQREMDFSTSPAWNGKELEPRPMALRLFLFHDGNDFQIMPGGLVRCAHASTGLPGLSPSHDSGSKDLWILSDNPETNQVRTNLPDREPIRRASGTLSSRAADNLYWIGRYSERAEFVTRLILEIANRLSVEHDETTLRALRPLLKSLAKLGYLSSKVDPLTSPDPRTSIRELLLAAYFSTDNNRELDSIPQNLIRLRNLASLSSDRLSGETWVIIQQLHELGKNASAENLRSLRPILQKALAYHSAFNGTCRENLTRNMGWIFLNLGRKIERAGALLNLVNEILALPPEERTASVLETLLSINDVTLTYRFRYQGAPQILPVLDVILHDPTNPRSLIFQLHEIDRDLRHLMTDPADNLPSQLHRYVLRALHFLETELLDARNDEDEAEQLATLTEFLQTVRRKLPRFTEQLGWQFFTHAEPQNT
ncbi:circularly permuted type 2 ATP-grasp protein [Roseibacillus ishigakijimensis]|uniref:Circularly permuted type 2 ATP-grasp protein n=1 Tax=Roseibacillus ishigakijimensis TaxID=454146 RepID=A0A934VN19_9BACT|nr:circularly permuted type 2 ATP-grasp protein [Roseibacillus ishigakijimensis]MBK1834560.1 circularly permuted type 2 ATP-grasp protein [Roseibacillus ishigakijimensis]